jgi:hypothetical protein
MSTEIDVEALGTERRQLDEATCLWLLSTEHVGRLLVLEPSPDKIFAPVKFVMAGGAVVVRVEPPAGAYCAVGSSVALDVDVFDPYSQAGWTVHVGGVVDRVLDGHRVAEELRPWTRRADECWLRIAARTVEGRWFRAPDHPPALRGGDL